MNTVGVHIESFGIYAVVLCSTSGQITVLDKIFLPLSLEGDLSQRQIEQSAKLKLLIKKYPLSKHHFVFSHKNTSVHDLKFPFKEKFKINKSLRYEIEELLPFHIENTVYSYKICYFHSNFSHVLSFVSSKKEIQERIQFLKTIGGMSPHLLIPESVALSNLFENWKSSPPHWEYSKMSADQIQLYLSYDNSFAVIRSNHRMIQVYDIHWSLKSCIQEISEKYKRSMDQAFSYFCENAFITTEEKKYFVPLLKIMNRSIQSLSHQLQLLLVHLKGEGHASIKEIQISGLGSQIQNLPSHLFQIFKIPFHTVKNHDTLNVPPEYLSALGTAIEGLKKPKNPPVDWMRHFRSSSKAMVQMSQKKRKRLQAIAVACVLFFFLYMGPKLESDRTHCIRESNF